MKSLPQQIKEQSRLQTSALNLKTGISPRMETLKSKESVDSDNYRYPDFGFEDNLNFGRDSNKQTIWQMLLDHISGEKHNERIKNIINLY